MKMDTPGTRDASAGRADTSSFPFAQTRSPLAGWQRWIEVALVFLVFFVHAAEPVPDVNEPHYLNKARHYWDATWAKGDFFLESADAHVVFYWTFGWITTLVPLAAAAWIGRLATWALMAFAWQRLSATVVPVRFMSVLSAAIFVALTEEADLAGEWVVGGVEAKGLAYFFVLLALERLVRNRWNAAWILLGIASAFHVLVGGWSVLLGLMVWASSRNRTPFSSMLPGLVCGGAIAAVGLLPAIALSYGESPEIVQEANRIYVFERLPHHLAILSQDPDRLFERLWRHLSGVVALFLLAWLHGRSTKWHDALVPNPIDGAPADSTIPDTSPSEPLSRIWRFALAALVLTMTGIVIELALQERPTLAAAVLRYYWYRMGDFAVPLGVALFAARAGELALVWRHGHPEPGSSGCRVAAALTLAALMAFPAWYLTKVTFSRLADSAPRTEKSNKVRDWGDWLEATAWIREHTPTDALFLTPRSNVTFKWRTGRPEVVSQKDIPQGARGIVEWHRRMDEVYGHTNEFGAREYVKSLGHQGTTRIVEIASAYGADYVLTDTRRILGLPIVHLNDTYAVYRLAAPD